MHLQGLSGLAMQEEKEEEEIGAQGRMLMGVAALIGLLALPSELGAGGAVLGLERTEWVFMLLVVSAMVVAVAQQTLP